MALILQSQRLSIYDSLSRVSSYLLLVRNMTTTGSTSPIRSAISNSPSSTAIENISFSLKTPEKEPQEYQYIQYPYYISRSSTKAKRLPIYLKYRSSGLRVQTCIRKVEGRVSVLHNEILEHFKLEKKKIQCSRLTQSITVEGDYASQV